MRLALFDFDGTITDRDTLFDFLVFTYGVRACVRGAVLLLPFLALYVMGIMPNWRAKERIFRHFFRGRSVEDVEEEGERYSARRLPRIVRSQALEKIGWHRVRGHRIAVVTASAEVWLGPWCRQNGMEVIATRLESQEGRYTGRMAGANCQGPEKVRRIRERLDLDEFDFIYAYGNSRGDAEMLALADERYYKWASVK